MSAKKPMALVILDGWGYREDNASNAINNAKTPVMDGLWQTTHVLLFRLLVWT
ncbi:2,3-bisphosphoglycerate-independent phosphoglycerate mutase [Vibrio maritimus]|uniref:2,3-bisphosphoglycerate-independent phosphoglycerate mutase n=1 Tax=Vibrio maritimus TaxID=990268 RepID=A0A090TBE9_9VIBR|nr:2,3-bisphosphoglycerate-independent phosphoglycerate mutase [Vibrio maritimus]